MAFIVGVYQLHRHGKIQCRFNMSEYIFNKAWCKGCGVCVSFCPKKALTLDEIAEKMERDPEKCIYCGLCEHYCPDLAITVVKDRKPKEAK